MSFFHIPANCHGAISNGRCVQAFNTGIKGVGIAMQDHTLYTASPFSNCSIYIIGTFVLMSSGNNNKGTCITHKTAKSDCFKNSTIRCVAAGCILRFMRGLGQQPQQERLWWITRGIACYNCLGNPSASKTLAFPIASVTMGKISRTVPCLSFYARSRKLFAASHCNVRFTQVETQIFCAFVSQGKLNWAMK